MLISKEDMPLVAMDFMNDVHGEDIDIINSLYELILNYEKNPNSENANLINKKYEEWFSHTVEHFKNEEIQMSEKNFPPYLFHKGEHDKVLSTMEEVFSQWKNTNDIGELKHYFKDVLPLWLVQHIQSMDTVTAMFLKTGLSPCSMH